MTSKRRILCVCSGNICRSPMAVALLRVKLDDQGVPAIVISAGTLGIQGRRADEFARAAVAELDAEVGEIIAGHRSQGLSPQLVDRADDVVVMAPRHERRVVEMVPDADENIVRLWAYADDTTLGQIPDPVGHDASVFRGCRDLINQCIDNWLDEWFE